MRAALPVLALALALLAPAASATVTTRSCSLATDALLSTGACSVAEIANAGLFVLIEGRSDTIGNAHVTMSNAAGGSIAFECTLDGASHACRRIVDTGGPDAGVWTVTGTYAGANAAGFAGATMTVDFLTF